MKTIPEQLAALTLRDNFNRADENPMASANWTKLSWAQVTGKIEGNRWAPATSFATKEDGAYWNPVLFGASAAIVENMYVEKVESRWGAVWVCLNPATQSGYRLKIVHTATSTKFEWRLEKITAGAESLLKQGFLEGLAELGETKRSFAVTCVEGQVQAWVKVEAGAWTELGGVADATYSNGRVAIEGRGFGVTRWDAFYAGELETAEGEAGVVKPTTASATASRPEPTVAQVAAPNAGSSTASMPNPEAAAGAMPSPTNEQRHGLPLPFPSVVPNPGRLGPPRFTSAERKTLRIKR